MGDDRFNNDLSLRSSLSLRSASRRLWIFPADSIGGFTTQHVRRGDAVVSLTPNRNLLLL
jgi:hypothetical protein